MKKITKIFLSLSLAAVMLASVAACSEYTQEGEGTAYGLVHSHYVGQVNIRTDADGKIVGAAFDEMQMPYNWARIDAFEYAEDDFDADAFHPNTDAGKRYAKSIVIGGKVFNSVNTSGESVGYPDYQCEELNKGVTLENWVKDNNNAKWYFEQMRLGNYGVSKSSGSGVINEFKEVNSLGLGDRWLKSKNGYWTVSEGLGWKGNMSAMSDYLMGNGFSKDGLVTKGDDKTWKVGEVSTGATLADFNDYMALARIAYGLAVTQSNNL